MIDVSYAEDTVRELLPAELDRCESRMKWYGFRLVAVLLGAFAAGGYAASAYAQNTRITIEQLSHSANLAVGNNSYSTTTTFIENKQTLSIHAATGALVELGHTPDSLTITAIDKEITGTAGITGTHVGKNFILTLTDIGEGSMVGVLQIGGKCFTARGRATSQIFEQLGSQVSRSNLPQGIGLAPLATAMGNNTKLVDFIVGRNKPLQAILTTCPAVCDCCSKSTFPFGLYCCIACFSCTDLPGRPGGE